MTQRSTRWAKGFATAAALSSLGFAALPVAAQTPAPQDTQFQVNTYTFFPQERPSVAMAGDGDFVVVWQGSGWSNGTDTSGASVQGQRYASDGSLQNAEFQVNTYTTADQYHPSVAAAADGAFVVVWSSVNGTIHGQRYTSNGTGQGEFPVSVIVPGVESFPSVAAAPNGDFVVVWDGSAGLVPIRGRRFASDGSTLVAEFAVSAGGLDAEPSVAVAPDGDFVVVWHGGAPTDLDVYGRLYNSDGSTQVPQFQVNTSTTNAQGEASVATAPDGGFLVVWTSWLGLSDFTIRGQRYAANGAIQGGELQVSTYTTNDDRDPSVAAAADGSFIVVWRSNSGGRGRRFASNGTPLGGEFQVDSYATGFPVFTSAAAAGGEFVVAWSSYGSPGTDSSYTSIQARRFILAASSTFESHIFQILGTSDAVPWSWRIAVAGGVTVASATSVGPVTNGGGPDLFATAFINSINANSGSSACLALATANTDKFEVKCPYAFQFFVNDAPGTGTECEVTGTLGGSGCPFNPTIVEVARAVPALSPSAGLALVAALMLLTVYALRRR